MIFNGSLASNHMYEQTFNLKETCAFPSMCGENVTDVRIATNKFELFFNEIKDRSLPSSRCSVSFTGKDFCPEKDVTFSFFSVKAGGKIHEYGVPECISDYCREMRPFSITVQHIFIAPCNTVSIIGKIVKEGAKKDEYIFLEIYIGKITYVWSGKPFGGLRKKNLPLSFTYELKKMCYYTTLHDQILNEIMLSDNHLELLFNEIDRESLENYDLMPEHPSNVCSLLFDGHDYREDINLSVACSKRMSRKIFNIGHFLGSRTYAFWNKIAFKEFQKLYEKNHTNQRACIAQIYCFSISSDYILLEGCNDRYRRMYFVIKTDKVHYCWKDE